MKRRSAPIDVINRLPDDVLLKIFTALLSYLTFFDHYNYDKIYKAIPFQMQASGVCRRWRNLVLSAPLLWTTVLIFRERGEDRLIALFLERSFPASISVEFRDIGSYGHDQSSSFLEAVDLISKSPRVHRLSIRIPPTAPYSFLCRLHGMNIPNLQYLDIQLPEYCHDDPDHQDQGERPLGRHKSLRSVRTSGLCLPCSFLSPNITNLDIHQLCPSSSNLKLIIDSLPALSSLIIRAVDVVQLGPAEHASAETPEIIQAHQLRFMSLRFSPRGHEGCSCGLPHLATKNLEVLEVCYTGLCSGPHHTAIQQRWGHLPSLRKFRLVNFGDWPSRSSYFTFLSSLPNPVDLEILGFPEPLKMQSFLQMFRVPKIKSITLELNDLGVIDLYQLFKMLSDPNICPVPLRILISETFPSREAASSALKGLKSLLGDTLELIVSTGPNGAFDEESEEEEREWSLSHRDRLYDDFYPVSQDEFEDDDFDYFN